MDTDLLNQGENRQGARPVGAKLGVPKPVVATPGLPKPALVKSGGSKLGVPKPGVPSSSGAYQLGAKPVPVKPEAARPGPVRLAVPNPVGPRFVGAKPGVTKLGVKPGEPRPDGPKVGVRPVGVTLTSTRPGGLKLIGTTQGPAKPIGVTQAIKKPVVENQGTSKPVETTQGAANLILPTQGVTKSIRVAQEVAKPIGATQGTAKSIAAAKGVVKPIGIAQKTVEGVEGTKGPEKPSGIIQGAAKQEKAAQGGTKSIGIVQEIAKPITATQEQAKLEEAQEAKKLETANLENAKTEEDKTAAAKSGLAKIGLSKLEAARQGATRLVVAKFGVTKGGSPKKGVAKAGEVATSEDKPEEIQSEEVKAEAVKTEGLKSCVAGNVSDKPVEINPEESKPSASKAEEAKSSESQQGAAKPSSSQTGLRGRTRRVFSRMAAIISKVKLAATSPPSLENNPICQYFEVGKQSCTAGPGLVWAVHDAVRIIDGKECSVFVFDKRIADKLFKPKRREGMIERIRYCVNQLEKMRHPRMLQIIHALEEGSHTFAFASESVMGSLHNILAWHESSPLLPGGQAPIMPRPMSLGPPPQSSFLSPSTPQQQRPPFAKEYYFIDIELRYGLLQIIEALHYMHYTVRQIHRNVCPQVIIVTKRGTWKLFGLEFVENMFTSDPTENLAVAPWSIKVAKICQPSLDFMAPEVQTNGQCNILSDMFSLGLVICAVFNGGKPLLQANNNPMLYMKQIEYLDQQVSAVLPRVPAALQEAVQRLLSRDPHPRPTTQLLPLIKYFKCQSEPAIQAMQFLDVITMKDANSKTNFYHVVLIDALPYIPKKLRWQHVWPILQFEVRTAEVLGAVLQPIIWLTNEATQEEFSHFVLPTLNYIRKNLMNCTKSIQATVTILENLHVILKKCQPDEVHEDVLPLLFTALDNNTNQIQTASLIAIQNVSEYLDDRQLHNIVLGKVKILLEKNQSDVKIISLVLGFFEKVLTRLERIHILEQVIPTLLAMRLTDPDIINRVVKLYKSMLAEQKFGLNTNVMATRMIPALAPQTVNPCLNADQFANLMDILYDMLENIDKDQRLRMKNEGLALASPERHRLSRHKISHDNVAPPFNIPNLRVEQRKTSSAEDMARKNSVSGPSGVGGSIGAFKSKFSLGTGIGQWFFGSSNSANNDNNFLRVGNAFPNRRLSDNTLMTPKIRIAPSCASSPGGTPGGNSGLPTRRHSSIGPQERRGSAVNLSPPTGYQYRGRGGSGSSLSVPSTSHCVVSDERPARKRPVAQPAIGGSMPNTSSSVPFLLTSSMQSIRSRRPSAVLGGSQGSGILQQLSSGMVRHLPMGSHHSMQAHVHAPLGAIQNATAAGYNALHHTAIAYQLFSGRS